MRRKIVKHTAKEQQHKCGECALATWVDKKTYPNHFAIDGHPLAMKCPNNKFLVLPSQDACSAFKESVK